jgi:site-specific recombinase XerD
MGRAEESRRRPIDILTTGEIDRLIRAVDVRSPIGFRNRAVIATQLRLLLRISETFRLRLQDYDACEGTLRIQAGKGDKYRVVGVDLLAATAIDAWIAVRPAYAKRPDSPLFCTHRGHRIKRTTWNESLSLIAQTAGIAKRVHPHGLRHTGACHLLSEGVDIRLISTMLGHSSLAVTHRYLSHLSPRDVIDAMRHRPSDLSVLGVQKDRFAVDPLEYGCA